MKKNKLEIKSLKPKSFFIRTWSRPICLLLILFSVSLALNLTLAQEHLPVTRAAQANGFRVGERLTYNISFGNFRNAAYAETFVVSRGKLEGKEAVELRLKIRTNDFVSAAFYLIDHSRTTFASAETGLPLFVRKTSSESGLPRETIQNYLNSPTVDYDLLSLIYQARKIGGIGNFPLVEDEKNYTVVFQNTVSEQVKTDAGDFDTSVSTVSSEYLTEKGIKDLRINFSQDENRIPVLVRFKTEKGEFRAELASLSIIEPEATTEPTPTPTPPPTPVVTPKPVPTATPYPENQPLSPDLPFQLGETLEYKVTVGGQQFGLITLQAKERTLFRNEDSLLLTARVTGIDQGNQIFKLNDGIMARVNPESIAPQWIELNLSGALGQYNQVVQFDQRAGTATFNGKIFPDVPVGTHSILSLAYAIRSFNLKKSKDPTNPVNDTRVAVFINDRAYVFILRPKDPDLITLQDRKISAQEISITTGIPAVDRLNIRLWLGTDQKRTPLRLSAGIYQADLISEKIIQLQKTEPTP